MPAKRTILATSALIYANGTPHLGHLVGTIQGDIWVRLQKMLGHECYYVCGSDAHGTPIMIQAEKMGMTPEALIQKMHREQMQDFADFHVEFDYYDTTHSETNRELVETIFKRHMEKGNISQRTIKQLFDPIKQLFLPDRYIKGECPRCGAKDQYGDNCESCGSTYSPIELKNPYSTLTGAKPIEKESEHYFFKLQNFEAFLKEWTHQGHLQTEVANKMDEWFKTGLQEWDISRDKPYFGFTIPGESEKYFYVWLDAPIGYMASFKHLCMQKQLDFDAYWKPDSKVELYHFIGKDIIYFHSLFWPAILKGADFRTPSAIFVNGFLTIDGSKMSKSRGTFIKARTYLNYLKPEYLRYYIAAKLSDRIEDIDLNFDDFTQRINADLVGKFINIASRSANFLTNHFDGMLSANCALPEIYEAFAKAGDEIKSKWDKLEYSQAIRQIMALADRANQYVDEKKPWKLIKESNKKNDVQEICSLAINLFRILTIYLKPVLPETAKQVESFLNIPALSWDDKNKPLVNHRIHVFKPLMERIDPKTIEAIKMSEKQEKETTETTTQTIEKEAPTTKPPISIDDFNKID
ncbi:MAG: methionine--tRNA ligase, partial [Gammaproteobacteria bacterium RIFCSPHIGHO2_12_FULL_43_28]